MSAAIHVEVDDHLGIITLNRPDKLHALTMDMAHELRRVAEDMDSNPDVWVILLRSSGDRAFCAGGDLFDLVPRAMQAGTDVMNPDPSSRFFSRVYTPIVSEIQGICLGGGFELMLGTDIRIASDRAVFGLPETKMGMISGGGSNVLLPRDIGWVRAMELMLEGETITAERALQVGLVNEVVRHEQLQARALARARRLTRNAPKATRAVKEIAVRSRQLDEKLALEHAINATVIVSADAAAGIDAFKTKSTATFVNA